MVGIHNAKDVANAENEGRMRLYTWRKTPSQASAGSIWFDLSMSPGNPVPQYYASAPLVGVAMRQSTDGGLYHGGNVAPQKKFLKKTMAMVGSSTGTPYPLILCDYLVYYPFIDDGYDGEQFLTSTALPRYTDGKGVQIMTISLASRTGGAYFTIKYVNQDGVPDRVTPQIRQNSSAAIGQVLNDASATAGNNGPFVPLQAGDTGVRSVQSVTMVTPDVGLFAVVLVKPLAQTQVRGLDAPVEKDYFIDNGLLMPVIEDDAYLNWLVLPQGSLSAVPIHGYIQTIWN